MNRSYRYQLRPTRAQAAVLFEWLKLTRELYNAALQERREAWTKQRVSVSLYDQQRALPDVRDVRSEFEGVPIVILRGALGRLDKAFKAFFRRCKSGDKPGFPRFKGRDCWSSILIDDLQKRNPIVAGGKRIAVALLGKIQFRQHRPLEGVPKAMRITLDAAGRWFVTLACVDVPNKQLPITDKDVGIDLGLIHLVATSDGDLFENPRFLRDARLRLERAQRRVSGRTRGSKRRRKAAKLLARHHERVANLRRENHIIIAKKIVKSNDRIYVEDLQIKNLLKSKLSKSFQDAGLGNFLHWLRVKAEEAGREVMEVDPHGTSQVCSSCGAVVRKGLSVRVHDCPSCGLRIDRDVNAACNVLKFGRLGWSLRGAALPVGGRLRSAKSMRQDQHHVGLSSI